MVVRELRLGDIIDDFCIKCRRLTNHAIVSLLDQRAAKVRCRTCYSDHDYRNEQAPPSKKDLKKAALFNQVLSGVAPAAEAAAAAVDPPAAAAADLPAAQVPEPARKTRKKA